MDLKNEPLRHHYIPRFILKNFVDDNLFWYWDNEKKYLSQRNVKNVFMNESMYRSENINENNPVEIEKNLAIFESEIAPIIKTICESEKINLNRNELEKLRIFLSLLSFRSDLRMKQYKNKAFNESTQKYLENYKGDEDFETFWKKEINSLAKCRTFDDVINLENVDSIIKLDFSNNLKGYFMTIVEARGQEFIISDVYPTLEIFPVSPTVNIHLHEIYPISPRRAIVLNNICFKKELMSRHNPLFEPLILFSQLKGNVIVEPQNFYKNFPNGLTRDDQFIYTPSKIYEADVSYINMLFLNETRVGFAFKNKENVLSSIRRYNSENREYNKNNFDLLEKDLEGH